MQRHVNDEFVRRAQREGYRSRAAYKLLEMDRKHRLLRRGDRVIDLGCAPGGWSQVSCARVGEGGEVIGIDLLPIESFEDRRFRFIRGDFTDAATQVALADLTGGRVDVVLSDMAPCTSGDRFRDHVLSLELAEAAMRFAAGALSRAAKGVFIAKYFQGKDEGELLGAARGLFQDVRVAKPKASRSESLERFIVCRGRKGGAPAPR